MKVLVCALLLAIWQISANPLNKKSLSNVIKEVHNLNDLIDQQLEALDNYADVTGATDTITDPTTNQPGTTDSSTSQPGTTDSPTSQPGTTDTPTSQPASSDTPTYQPETDTPTYQPGTDTPTYQPGTNTPTYQPGSTKKPIQISELLEQLEFMQSSARKLVKFYWSIHQIRNMLEKDNLVVLYAKDGSVPALIPSSTLIKVAMKQLQEANGDLQKMGAFAAKKGFAVPTQGTQMKDSHKDCDSDDHLKHEFLNAEIEASKFFWTMKKMVEILKRVKKMKESSTTPSTTPPRPSPQFIKRFVECINEAMEGLPKFYKLLEKLKEHVEDKEEIMQKLTKHA